MLLTQRQHNFLILFPKTFFSDELKSNFEFYRKQLLLPYTSIDDFMSSTIQSVNFPGWKMDLRSQTRKLGAKQDFKNAVPVKDLLERSFTISFKLSDGFLNYFLFLNNSIDYLDFNNESLYFDDFKFILLNNEGYMIGTADFHQLILKGMSNVKLDYSNMERNMTTFTADFQFNDWDITLLYDDSYPKV